VLARQLPFAPYWDSPLASEAGKAAPRFRLRGLVAGSNQLTFYHSFLILVINNMIKIYLQMPAKFKVYIGLLEANQLHQTVEFF